MQLFLFYVFKRVSESETQLNRLTALQKTALLQQEQFGDQSSVSSFQIWATFYFDLKFSFEFGTPDGHPYRL
jgi:hypothetical protein